jgi:hypothetical protein
MNRPQRTAAALTLSTFAMLGLAACTAPSDTTEEAATTESAESVEEPDELVGPSCLIGDWYIEQDQMQVFYDALGDENPSVDMQVQGGTGLRFAEDVFEYTPEFSLLVTAAGMEGTGAITGSIGGQYTADESQITTSQETNDTALTVTIGGVVQDGSGLFGSLLASSPIHSAAYECTAAGPLIQFDTGGEPVPVQLTAR